MLGWMLRRGENVVEAGDTTQIDQPDTPAPVFAARAFKSALFGTPAPRSDAPQPSRDKIKAKTVASTAERDSGTPLKPQGILLTPGTGTTRRKRVSFNHEVLASVKSSSPNGVLTGKAGANSKRTRLSEALERATRKSTSEGSKKLNTLQTKDGSDEDWEEDDDDDDYCTNDITLDLNEPHSQSGRYWKGEFERYHLEAKAEMEKLLKYKQLAKSYAQAKDAEAIQLAETLKEQQTKVIAMERKIAENASQMVSKQREASDVETPELLATLTKQTILAAQHRLRVQELEEQFEDLLQEREQVDESKGRKRRQGVPSPTTQRTLLETQRELRRARSQLKELDALREKVASLKAQLKTAGQCQVTNKATAEKPADATDVEGLKTQLNQTREESAKKDDEIRHLKSDFEAFRKESEVHDADTKAVLERAHTKISDLRKEVRALKAAGSTEQARPRSWHPRSADDQLTNNGVNMEGPASRTPIPSVARRSVDLADLDQPDALSTANCESRTLRDKYQEGGTVVASENETAPLKPRPGVVGDRPNLEKPRWQPFVPRSPRNRAYLDDDMPRRIQNGGTTTAGAKLKELAVPDLPALAKSIARSKRARPDERGDVEVDLLQDRYARLGGSDASQDSGKSAAVVNIMAKSALPPERRAAALARIERRMAEKRAQRRDGADKENVRP